MSLKTFTSASIITLTLCMAMMDANATQFKSAVKDKEPPISVGANRFRSTGSQPGHSAAPAQPKPMTPEYFAAQCSKYGGGASMNPDGTFKCTKPNGAPGVVPYPIPID